jgi:hypothetical protein
VKLFLPVGWTVRTVTSEQGKFRLTVGATQQPRKTRKPLVTDLGTRVSSPQGKAGNYAIYLLPEAYKECSATDAPPIETPARTTRKRKGHPKSRAH